MLWMCCVGCSMVKYCYDIVVFIWNDLMFWCRVLICDFVMIWFCDWVIEVVVDDLVVAVLLVVGIECFGRRFVSVV